MNRLFQKIFSCIDAFLQVVGSFLLRRFEGRTAGQVLVLLICLTTAVIGVALILPGGSENPMAHFEEFRVATFYSVAQLLACSALAWAVFRERQREGNQAPKAPFRLRSLHLWVVISFGFLFLAADDLLLIHEIIDKLIHLVGGIEETTATDKIDDYIIALYAIAALAVLCGFRREFLKFRSLWPYFLAGFLCLGGTIALDLKLTDSLIPLVPTWETILSEPWIGVWEESFKLYGGSFFVAAFYGSYLKVATAKAETAPASGPVSGAGND